MAVSWGDGGKVEEYIISFSLGSGQK
jgi:hypothetical protein